MPQDLIYLPGQTHPHGLKRLQREANLLHQETPDPQALTDDERQSVVAIASFFDGVDGAMMDTFPNLQIVSSFGVGYDHIDAKTAASRGIMVTHTPDVLNDEVADTTIGLLLNTLRNLPRAEQWLRDRKWKREGKFPLSKLTMRERTVGIYGLGRIGQTIGKRLEGFDVDIHYHSRKPVPDTSYTYHASLLDMAKAVDTLISIVPSTSQTDHSVNAEVLAALGKDGVFINVGRGTVANDEALIAALIDGTIAAAGLDVFTDEPNVPDALLHLDNVVLLPHVASASVHTRQAMADLVVDNLLVWLNGKPALTPVPETRHITR